MKLMQSDGFDSGRPFLKSAAKSLIRRISQIGINNHAEIISSVRNIFVFMHFFPEEVAEAPFEA